MAKSIISRVRQLTERFASDRGGVAAIEFAFMVPILLILYIGSMELSQAIETNKKVGRTASMVADLVTQQQTVNKAMLEGIMQIGASTMRPYNRSWPTIKITAISIDATNRAKEVWWRQVVPNEPDGKTFTLSGGKPANQVPVPPLPSQLQVANSFLIRVTASMGYDMVLKYNDQNSKLFGISGFFGGIPMSETYYLRPRMSDTIACDNC